MEKRAALPKFGCFTDLQGIPVVETKDEARVSIRAKLESAKRLLRGESPDAVAEEFGVRREIVGFWRDRFVSYGAKALRKSSFDAETIAAEIAHATENPETAEARSAFLRAGRRSLGSEFAPGEIPTLEEIEDIAQRGFPAECLEGAQSVVAFFAARFYGRNDVIHLAKAGIPSVHCVDIDAERLDVMATIYPSGWTYEAGDAYALAQRYYKEKRTFDVAICDCTHLMALRVLLIDFPVFSLLCERFLLCYINREMFDRLEIEFTARALSDRMSRWWKTDIEVPLLSPRSSAYGGTCWAVIRPADNLANLDRSWSALPREFNILNDRCA